MHRFIRRSLLAASLGLCSTLLVAWALAILVEVPGDVYDPRSSAPAEIGVEYFGAGVDLPSALIVRYHRLGSEYVSIDIRRGYFSPPPDAKPLAQVIPGWAQAQTVTWRGPSPAITSDQRWYAGSRGWPLPALWCEFETSPALPWNGLPKGGLALPWPRVAPGWYLPPPPLTALPYRPVWSGILINSICFALLWWGGLALFGTARRAVRRRAGRCEFCGYVLRGLAPGSPCPECGTAPRTTAATHARTPAL